jgi:hypothetical protein
VSVTALQVLLEFQRDWARHEHCDDVIRTVKAHGSVFGLGSENARPEMSNRPPIPTEADLTP